MATPSWIQSIHAAIMRGRTTRQRRQRSRQVRPRVLVLEDRVLPSAVSWTGAAGNFDWDTPGNWSTGALPGATDDVVINQSGITVTHAAGNPDAINSLTSQANISISGGSLSLAATSTIAAGLTLDGGTLAGAGNMTVDGMFTWSGGTLSGGGSLTAAGGLAISAPGSGMTLDGRSLVSPATATWTGGTVHLLDGATFTNQGTFLDQTTGNGSFIGFYGDATTAFDNDGAYTKVGDSSNTLALVFNNTGSLEVQTGTLDINGLGQSCVSSGSFTGDAGTTLILEGQVTTLAQGLTGDNVMFRYNSGGTYTIAGPYQANDTDVEAYCPFKAENWDCICGSFSGNFRPQGGFP